MIRCYTGGSMVVDTRSHALTPRHLPSSEQANNNNVDVDIDLHYHAALGTSTTSTTTSLSHTPSHQSSIHQDETHLLNSIQQCWC